MPKCNDCGHDEKLGPGIHIKIGPMRGGKTRRVVEMLFAGNYEDVIALRPSSDTRDDHAALVSRNDAMWKASRFSTLAALADIGASHKTIVIDEVHLIESLEATAVDVVKLFVRWAAQGKTIILSGLLTDATREPFAITAAALLHADTVEVLHAECRCGDRALYSKRLVESDAKFLVGDAEYEPRCGRCFDE